MPTIAVDAMGGDSAPDEVVRGAVAAQQAGHDVVLVGDADRVAPILDRLGATVPVEHAAQVIEMDDELDQRMSQTFRVMLSHMIENPKTISRGLRLTFVAKYFERIGDQATNICEMVVFMTEARVIKHATDAAD